LLEIGCGYGYGSQIALIDYGAKSVVGIDASKFQTERANKKIHGILKDRLTFLQSIAENIPFPDSSFNGIFSVEAVQHFNSVPSFVKESFRLLRKGGKIVFCTFYCNDKSNVETLKEKIPIYKAGLDNILIRDELLSFLENTGFVDVKNKSIGKYVWDGFLGWTKQVRLPEKWIDAENRVKAYKQGVLDYGIFTATKV